MGNPLLGESIGNMFLLFSGFLNQIQVRVCPDIRAHGFQAANHRTWFEAPPHSSNFLNLKSQLATYLSPRLPSVSAGTLPKTFPLISLSPFTPFGQPCGRTLLASKPFCFKRDSLFVDVLWVFEVSIGRFPGDTAPQI